MTKARVFRFSHEAMTTIFEIVIADQPAGYAGQAARAAFDEIDRLEGLFCRFDPSSEISRLSRLAPGASLRICVETAEILRLSGELEMTTGGTFSVNRPAAGDSREPRARSGMPTDGLISLLTINACPGYFEAVRNLATPAGPRLELDLGAVGKGWALDAAAAVLADWDVENALLHSGTSTVLGIGPGPEHVKNAGPHTLAHKHSGKRSPSSAPGSPPGERPDPSAGWPVGLTLGTSGDEPAPIHKVLHLNNRAVSGSGLEVKGPHIYDPRTGRPARGKLLAVASHPAAAVSDALSTAFFVMDAASIEHWCRDHPEVWAAVLTAGKKCKIFNICL